MSQSALFLSYVLLFMNWIRRACEEDEFKLVDCYVDQVAKKYKIIDVSVTEQHYCITGLKKTPLKCYSL